MFAGIGGFSYALKNAISNNKKLKNNLKCLYVSEIDKHAKETYIKNFNYHDEIFDINDFEKHLNVNEELDIVFCGFPCQSFSNAGQRKGFSDTKRGKLIYQVAKFVEKTSAKIVLLENVNYLVKHDEGKTFYSILKLFGNDYVTTKTPLVLSPTEFNIVQNRKRVFIPFVHKSLTNKKFLEPILSKTEFNNRSTNHKIIELNENNLEHYKIERELEKSIEAWEEFINYFLKSKKRIPVIWLDEMLNTKYVSKSKSKNKSWYLSYMKTMKDFYFNNQEFINSWVLKHKPLLWKNRKYRKLEWQAGFNTSFKEAILQVRQSGLRFKKQGCFPTLVAIVQTPIIFSSKTGYWRYLTPKEVSRLQSFPEDHQLCQNDFQAYKQYGNAINVMVAEWVIRAYLINYMEKLLWQRTNM